MGVCTLSCFSYVWLFVTPWTVACQAPLSMGCSRQEYWSGLPFSSTPGDLPDPGTEPVSLASPALQVDSLPDVPLGKPGKNKQEAKLAFWLLNEQRISDPKETERESTRTFFYMCCFCLSCGIFLIKKYLICLAAAGLSCSMQTQLWRVGSSSPTREQTQTPCVGSTVLVPGPPGKSLSYGILRPSISSNSAYKKRKRTAQGLQDVNRQWCECVQCKPWCGNTEPSMQKIWFSSVQSFGPVRLFATAWTAARQASLSITNSRSLLKLMSMESMMPSNHLILCHSLLLLPSIFPSIRVFSNESVLLFLFK